MKTIFVVYSDKVLTEKELTQSKYYSFNTEADVKAGDFIKSSAYTTRLLVVKVLEEKFMYYNFSTGDLSNTLNSTSQREIKTLVIKEADAENTVYGYIDNE